MTWTDIWSYVTMIATAAPGSRRWILSGMIVGNTLWNA